MDEFALSSAFLQHYEYFLLRLLHLLALQASAPDKFVDWVCGRTGDGQMDRPKNNIPDCADLIDVIYVGSKVLFRNLAKTNS